MTAQKTARPRLAARLEDWMHARNARRAVRRGKRPSVIPYIGYGTTEWVRVFARVLYLRPKTREHTRFRPDVQELSRVRGWRTFTSLPVPHHRVKIFVDDQLISTVIADRGGVVDCAVPASLSPGWHKLRVETMSGDSASAPVNIVSAEARLGVISDVDDTILITALPKPLVAAWNSFVLDENARRATPGMAVTFDRLQARYPDAPFVYLSTGAWNAAPALSRFMARNLYPVGPLLLTDWGPTHDRWFRSGSEHKRCELSRLVAEFPGIRWLLIGDDGQHDEDLYHNFASRHPERVAAVVIRQLSVGEAVLAGARSKARIHRSTSGVPWIYGSDGAAIEQQLADLGLL